jgi:type VI secretion system protein ImpM
LSRPPQVGFYGKLPSHGDFLRRRVSDAFVAVWDPWLQECIAASRSILGERWLDIYLTSPAWRFACAPGTFADAPVVGLMVPSVDRVGRYFYLTIVAELPNYMSVVAAAAEFTTFFDSAAALVIETLAADDVDFERFDEGVTRLGDELEVLCSRRQTIDPCAAAIVNEPTDEGWQIPIGSPPALAPVFVELLAHRLAALYNPLGMWWTDGSAVVEPSCLIAKGLPDPGSFAALLDGSWTSHNWRSVPAPSAESTGDTLVEDSNPPRFRSASASDVGRVRPINQDSLLERTEVGLWAVADGLGGHSHGEVASRMVCDALADFVPESGFEQMIEDAVARLHQVNDHLVRAAARSHNAVLSGSTVAALMARGTRCAVLWAGDSRVYRMRSGRLEQLTRDHSLVAESEGLTSAPSNIVTRAIGGEATLTVDVQRERVSAGDRFLLCSDGLTRMVPEAEIQRWMEDDDIQAAVEGLIAATLSAGAPDNVTVLIVEAFQEGDSRKSAQSTS